MRNRKEKAMTCSLVKMLGGLVIAASATSAAFGQTIPAGLGCEFGLIFEPLEAGHQFVRLDRLVADHGRSGILIVAGQFGRLKVSNETTGESLVLPGRGANLMIVNNADGTQTLTFTGYWVISWFPTDTPAGPSTIQYVGRLVVLNTTLQDGTVVSVLQSVSGKEVLDVCAALS
jgi:hypothetical protein